MVVWVEHTYRKALEQRLGRAFESLPDFGLILFLRTCNEDEALRREICKQWKAVKVNKEAIKVYKGVD